MKKKEREMLIQVILGGVALVALVFSFGSHLRTERNLGLVTRQYQTSFQKLENDLAATRAVVTALTKGNATLAQTLEDEQLKREAAEESAKLSQKTIASIQADVATQRQTLEAADISRLIGEWSPRVVRVSCNLALPDGVTQTSKASGVVTVAETTTQIYTSKHVVEKDNKIADNCEIQTAGADFDSTAITIDTARDLAFINYDKLLPIVGAGTAVRKCATRPILGDQVVILGYPSVGSKESITATEGIISGFDKKYYITSAKIERGNSGGAAIHVKNNCLLGLPTLVVAGQVESLARILAL